VLVCAVTKLALGIVVVPRTGLLAAAKPCGNRDSSIPSSCVA